MYCCMVAPVERGIFQKRVLLYSCFKGNFSSLKIISIIIIAFFFTNVADASFKSIKLQISKTTCTNTLMSIRKMSRPSPLEVILSSVMDQPRGPNVRLRFSFLINNDQASTGREYIFHIVKILLIKLRLSKLDCQGVSKFRNSK